MRSPMCRSAQHVVYPQSEPDYRDAAHKFVAPLVKVYTEVATTVAASMKPA